MTTEKGRTVGDPRERVASSPVVAVLGAGDWARTYHMPALKILEAEGLLAVGGIWNRTGAKARDVARDFGIARVYETLDEAVEDQRVAAYSVLVSPAAIPAVVERLLPRGLPIFTEKTPGKTWEQASELAAKATVANVVAFNRRYMPVNRRFKELVDSLDRVHFVECHFYRHGRTYENFVTHTGIHGVNCMEYFFGPIVGVKTDRWLNTQNATNLWAVRIEFASGARGVMKFLPCTGSSVERYEAHSNSTSLYLASPQTYTSDYPGTIIVHRDGKRTETIEGREEDGVVVNAGFVDEYRDFLRCIATGDNGVSNIANSCNSMKVAEAIEGGAELP